MNNPIKTISSILLILCAYLGTSSDGQAAEPVASSEGGLTAPTIVDFGDLSEDATYVFYFNAKPGGASTAIAGNDAWGLKLEQWPSTGVIGTTEFGVIDNQFEPDGQGSPESIYDQDVHVVFVNDSSVGETLLYVDGVLSGYIASNFELSGEVKVMAARMSTDGDAMGADSILYAWATYNEALGADEIQALADAAEPTYPLDPVDSVDPVNPTEAIASSTYAHLHPAVVDFGGLSESASYAFFFNASKDGASTAIAGNDAVAFKLDQWNEQGVFGLTEFGVADHVFDAAGEGTTASVFDRDVHVVLVNDASSGETRLYVDGALAGTLAVNVDLGGSTKVMGARLEQATDHMGAGSVLYTWSTYNAALDETFIAELAASAVAYDPTGPFTEPTIVDMGPIEGDATYEFFFNAQKDGASTAIAGNPSWGLKLDQWNEQGVIGITEFGVVDSVFELEGDGSDEAVFGEDLHVVFVNDITMEETRLYVNGVYVGYLYGNFAMSGPTKVMAARIDVDTDPMGAGSVLYYWKTHEGVLSETEIAGLYEAAETREPTTPVDPVDPQEPTGPEVPEGALSEPTIVDFGDIFGNVSLEFSFHAIQAGASTAIAGNDSWGLKLDQWNQQGVFGITEFGVVDSVFEPDGPGSTASIFDERVHVVFVNDVDAGETRLYVNGLYAGYMASNFDLYGEVKLMAARIGSEVDAMAEGSVMYHWEVHESILSESEIADLAAAQAPTTPGSIEGIQFNGNGGLEIIFTGTLESSDQVTGPFTPVEDASSPYTLQPEAPAKFYLAR